MHVGNPEDMQGVVFTDTPLPEKDGCRLIEVCLTETRQGEADGLTLGVTTALPNPGESHPDTADDILESWSIGFDGCAHVDGVDEMLAVSWNPADLRNGDTVGFVVLSSGEAYVRVNGKRTVDLPATVRVGCPLYGFIDLLGNAKEVSL
eukprot:4309407-Amphidinium_carterae.1